MRSGKRKAREGGQEEKLPQKERTEEGRAEEGRMGQTGSAPRRHPKRWLLSPSPGAPASQDPHLAKAEAAAMGPPELPGLNPEKGGT